MTKKIFIAALALCTSSLGFSQVKVSDQQFEQKSAVITSSLEVESNRGAAFFAEDFSNGFDGANGIGPWFAEDSQDAEIWHMNTPTSPDGGFSQTQPGMNSMTSDNGWAIFDGDAFYSTDGTPDPQPYGSLTGFLSSPSIDMSEKATVMFEFRQFFRYCCQNAFPLTIGVSNDGGNEWFEFDATGSFTGDANETSVNSQLTIIDISCAAAFEADVMIRFSYNAADGNYSHYFWGVDDVFIYENPNASDLSIKQVLNGDIFNFFEHSIMPMEQAVPAADGGLMVGTIYENFGNNDMEGTTITIEILDDAGSVLSTTVSDAFTVNVNTNSTICPTQPDTLYIDTGWEPPTTGFYTLRSTIASTNEDANPGDNVMEKLVEYTTQMMGHDDFGDFDFEIRQSTAPADEGGDFRKEGFGNYFSMFNEGSEATGVVVWFGPNTTEDVPIEVRLYTCLATEGVNGDNATFETTFYDISADDIPTSVNNPVPTFIEFGSDVDLDASGDFYYFAAVVIDEEGEGEMSVLASGLPDNDFSSSSYELTTTPGTYFWFSRQDVPAVRLAFGDNPLAVGIDELTIDGLDNMVVSPNPASISATIAYTLARDLNITTEVTDITGRVLNRMDRGTMQSGTHNINLDVRNLSNGVYFYSIISGGDKVTKKFVVKK